MLSVYYDKKLWHFPINMCRLALCSLPVMDVKQSGFSIYPFQKSFYICFILWTNQVRVLCCTVTWRTEIILKTGWKKMEKSFLGFRFWSLYKRHDKYLKEPQFKWLVHQYYRETVFCDVCSVTDTHRVLIYSHKVSAFDCNLQTKQRWMKFVYSLQNIT